MARMIRSRFSAVPLVSALASALALAFAFTLFATAAPAQPPPGASDALDRAFQAMGRGDFDAAVTLLEGLRASGDASNQALSALGALYVETGKPDKALEVLRPLADADDADAAVLYNAGRAARAVGLGDVSEGYLKRSLAIQRDTPAERELGLLYGAEKRYPAAYRLLRPWVMAHAEDKEARLAAALCAIQLKRSSEAEELLTDLPQSDPATAVLWGQLLFQKGEPQKAVAMLQPVVDNDNPAIAADARRALADAYLEIGDSDKAVALLSGKTDNDPGSSLLLARAQYQGGDLDAALATLKPFAEKLPEIGIDRKDPRSVLASSIVREYGRWLVNAGRHQEAIPYLRLATEADPSAKEAWKALGQALAATGDRDAAREALAKFQELAKQEGSETERVNRAREQRADPAGRAMHRAAQLMSAGKASQAVDVLKAERELSPDDVRLPIFESRALMLAKRPAEALQVAEEAVRMAPDAADSIYQRGAAHLGLEQRDLARADFEHALQLNPDHLATLNDLAVLLIVQGERDKARQLLQHALEVHPGDPQATATLKRLNGGGQGAGR